MFIREWTDPEDSLSSGLREPVPFTGEAVHDTLPR
ncbi:MAG: hypothetical protein JWN86_4785 [Planctomycetota bacterium]|nr:hypothetical protein [Planctomycetota bacterium]